MATDYTEAQKNLMRASFALGQAQRELEDAECAFQKAIAEAEQWENAALPTAEDVRGLLPRHPAWRSGTSK